MNILLIILLILTIGNIVWLIIDLLTTNKNWGLVLVILTLIFLIGWVMAGLNVRVNTKNIEIMKSSTKNIEVIKSSTKTYVEIDGKTWEFKEHQDYININDSTLFYYEIGYNMYNSEISRQLKYNN